MRTRANGSNFGVWFFTAGVLIGLSGCGGDSSGAASGAGDGSTSGSSFGHCDVKDESSAHPLIQACGDITGPLGVNVKLGPYGAQMDVNVGAGFENTGTTDATYDCASFVTLFPEDPTITQQLLDVGPQPCTTSTPNTGNCLNFQLYSVYRPAKWPDGKIPVLAWGNGTCAQPEGYGTLLRYIASYGFFVIAANTRQVGDGTAMLHALDFAAAANQDPKSPYYGHLDFSKVGAMGHSQGSLATATAASDSRIQSVILFNWGQTAVKPFLAVSGDFDLFGYTAQSMATQVDGQPKAAYLYYHNPAGNTADTRRGHLVIMLTPERVVEQATGFWQMMLNNDATARNLFVGTNCAFCNHSSDYDYGQHGL